MNATHRRDGIVITHAGNDLIVFDQVTNQLHTLPAAIAAVWNECTGSRSTAHLAQATNLSVDEVVAAVDQLSRAGLLMEPVSTNSRHDRRKLLRGAVVGAAIVSVTVPSAAAQASTACWCGTILLPNEPSLYLCGLGTYFCGNPASFGGCLMDEYCFTPLQNNCGPDFDSAMCRQLGEITVIEV